MCLYLFFFFKQKTAYEMRISDWSSDVCSSDLARERGDTRPVIAASAGNHAQGLAWAGYRLRMPVITVMPRCAPQTQLTGVAHWGAPIRLPGDSFDAARRLSTELAAQHGQTLRSAFHQPVVVVCLGPAGTRDRQRG